MFTGNNYVRLTKALVYIKSNLIDSDNNMYFTVNSFWEINNLITGSHITFRQVIVKPYEFDKMYMDNI